jgi:UPF0716 protein FxsA
MWLFFLFVAVPIIEIALFIQVGGAIGLWPTLAIVVATALAGTVLMRWQGVEALRRLQAALERGGDPSGPLVHGALILVAGVLLLTPGFFTDAVGLSLLVPPVRAALIAFAGRHILSRGVVVTGARFSAGPRPGGPGGRGPEGPGTIEGEFEVLDDDAPEGPDRGGDRRRGDSGWTRH